MRGQTVIVRADGGTPLVRKIWQVDDQAVYITDDATLAKLAQGQDAPFPIGFPPEDVFEYEPEAAARIGRPDWSWSTLSRWG